MTGTSNDAASKCRNAALEVVKILEISLGYSWSLSQQVLG